MTPTRRLRLGEKLRRLSGAGPGSASSGPTPPSPDVAGPDVAGPSPADAPIAGATRAERIDRLRVLLRKTLERPRARGADGVPTDLGPPASVSAELPGEVQETRHGPIHVLDRYFEPHHHHGRVPVADALRVRPETLASLALDPALSGVDPTRLLFLDTETTGLAGGTGTVPFLVGVAWFEDQSFRCEQLLLRRLGEEAPILERVAERVRAASALVTFNGKSFDWPLLRTRAVLSRVALPTPPAHLDLLHCARRIFRPRMPDGVRLVQLEENVLGHCREHDVAGSEIPGLYFAFLRGVELRAMGPILEHNALDLLALAALIARVGLRYEEGAPDDDPRDQLGFAHVADRAGDPARAAELARAAVGAGELAPEHAYRATRLVAELARRRGDLDEERRALEEALSHANPDGMEAAQAHLRLAIHHEHRRKDPRSALFHARRSAPAEGEEAHARRLDRLARRLARGDAGSRASRRTSGDQPGPLSFGPLGGDGMPDSRTSR